MGANRLRSAKTNCCTGNAERAAVIQEFERKNKGEREGLGAKETVSLESWRISHARTLSGLKSLHLGGRKPTYV